MLATEYARRDRNVTFGCDSEMTTLSSEGVLMARMPDRRNPADSGSLAPNALARSRENFTAAALNGSPSANLTPARSTNV